MKLFKKTPEQLHSLALQALSAAGERFRQVADAAMEEGTRLSKHNEALSAVITQNQDRYNEVHKLAHEADAYAMHTGKAPQK